MNAEERAAKISKLPKWAQSEISGLQRRLSTAEAAAAVTDALQHGDGWLSYYSAHPRAVLPVGQRIRFPLGSAPGVESRHWIDVRRDGHAIEIMASESITVSPVASNVVSIRLGT